jgi:hypothetical protein
MSDVHIYMRFSTESRACGSGHPDGCYTLDCRRAFTTRRSQGLSEFVSELSWCVCKDGMRCRLGNGHRDCLRTSPERNLLVPASRLCTCTLGCILADLILASSS